MGHHWVYLMVVTMVVSSVESMDHLMAALMADSKVE